MTFQGGYRACNRMGIDSSASPFLKMSFETATVFLMEATLHKFSDYLESLSARIVVGRIVKMGTGSFDLLQNIDSMIAFKAECTTYLPAPAFVASSHVGFSNVQILL